MLIYFGQPFGFVSVSLDAEIPEAKEVCSSTLYQLRTDNRFLVTGVKDSICALTGALTGALLRPSLLHFGGVDLETGSRLAGEAGRGDGKGWHVMRVGVELVKENPHALKYCIVIFCGGARVENSPFPVQNVNRHHFVHLRVRLM